MTQEEQEVLIAEYLGFVLIDGIWVAFRDHIGENASKFFIENQYDGNQKYRETKFTKTLDWIEPVLEKINEEADISIYTAWELKDRPTRNGWGCKIDIQKQALFIGEGKLQGEAIVEAVAQYIKWKNKQNK